MITVDQFIYDKFYNLLTQFDDTIKTELNDKTITETGFAIFLEKNCPKCHHEKKYSIHLPSQLLETVLHQINKLKNLTKIVDTTNKDLFYQIMEIFFEEVKTVTQELDFYTHKRRKKFEKQFTLEIELDYDHESFLCIDISDYEDKDKEYRLKISLSMYSENYLECDCFEDGKYSLFELHLMEMFI